MHRTSLLLALTLAACQSPPPSHDRGSPVPFSRKKPTAPELGEGTFRINDANGVTVAWAWRPTDAQAGLPVGMCLEYWVLVDADQIDGNGNEWVAPSATKHPQLTFVSVDQSGAPRNPNMATPVIASFKDYTAFEAWLTPRVNNPGGRIIKSIAHAGSVLP